MYELLWDSIEYFALLTALIYIYIYITLYYISESDSDLNTAVGSDIQIKFSLWLTVNSNYYQPVLYTLDTWYILHVCLV